MELHVDVLAVLGQAIDWVCSCIACVGCIRGFVCDSNTGGMVCEVCANFIA